VITAAVPELADGGYWYVSEAVTDPHMGGITAGVGFPSWCAWYAEIDGAMYCAVRTPVAMTGANPTNDTTVAEIIGSGQKPFGRIGGL